LPGGITEGLNAIANSVNVTSTVDEPLADGEPVASVDDPPFFATETIPIAPMETTMAITANIIKENRKSLLARNGFLVGLSDIFVTSLCVNNLVTNHSIFESRVRHSISSMVCVNFLSHKLSYLHYLNGTNCSSSRS